ncbi:hypothetical protein Q5752_002320 [Cryptotrichosporon argae]
MATPKIRAATAASPSALSPSLPRALSSPPCTLTLVASSSLTRDSRDALYALFDSNMAALSAGTSMAYTPRAKRAEMFDPAARYVIARETGTGAGAGTSTAMGMPMPGALEVDADEGEDEVLGFVGWRFDTEETAGPRDAEVVYLYELHLAPRARGTGLADVLMDELEAVGRRWGMEKVMLTVLKRNARAVRFYERRGWAPDEIDPTRVARDGWEDVGADEGEGGDDAGVAEVDEDENEAWDEAEDGEELGAGSADGESTEYDYIIMSKALR